MTKNKKRDQSTDKNRFIITAPVVSKHFRKKNGVLTDRTELYIQRSVQDYFIKFCESAVSRKTLERYLSAAKNEIKAATLEVEFREGYLDICDENYEQQSRIGKYVIIHSIIEDPEN